MGQNAETMVNLVMLANGLVNLKSIKNFRNLFGKSKAPKKTSEMTDAFEEFSEGAGAIRVQKGNLIVTAKNPSSSELKAAEHMRQFGNVELRDPIKMPNGKTKTTSDLLVDGMSYDVYTPETANPDRIISAVSKKSKQAQGIVIDLSETTVKKSDLGDVLKRVQNAGSGKNKIQDIRIIE